MVYELIKPAPGQQSMFPMMMDAEFSDDRLYRYSLTRRWDQDGTLVNFIMLNPSTASEVTNDNTIRRCISFADIWGYGGLIVTNLFAFRSTDPRTMLAADDPIGPKNDESLLKHALECDRVVCAWGNHGVYKFRNQEVIQLLKGQVVLSCLCLTKIGQPGHPLRLHGKLMPTVWSPAI